MFSLLLIRVPFKLRAFGDQLWFTNKIDHTNPNDERTYQQRYYVNTQYTEGKDKSKTLIFYIGGESELDESSVTNGAVITLAEETKAIINIKNIILDVDIDAIAINTESNNVIIFNPFSSPSLLPNTGVSNRFVKKATTPAKAKNIPFIVGGKFKTSSI